MYRSEGGDGIISPNKMEIKLSNFLGAFLLSLWSSKANLEDLTKSFNAFYWFEKFKQNIFLSIRNRFSTLI